MAECVERSINCGICLSAYTKPIILDCYHVFCTPCIEKLAEGEQCFTCPLCKLLLLVPENGINDFRLYKYFEQISEDLSKTATCEMCLGSRKAFSKCDECSANMCSECHEYHLKHVKFKTHTTEIIVSCDVLSLDKNNYLKDTCEIHALEQGLFCRSCNRAICEKCESVNHNLHKTAPLSFEAQKRRDKLQSAIGALKSKIKDADTEIEISKYEENAYYKLCRQGKEDIKAHAERTKKIVYNMIDTLTNVEVQAIEKMQKGDKQLITNYQDNLETEKLSLQSLLKSSEDIVNLFPDGRLMNDCAYLYQALKAAVEHRIDKPMICGPQFHSVPFEHHYVENCFGKIKRRENSNVSYASSFHLYSLPDIDGDITLRTLLSFNTEEVRSLYGISGDKIWIQTSNAFKLHSYEHAEKSQSGSSDDRQIVWATKEELWVKTKDTIKKVKVGTTEFVIIIQHPSILDSACCLTADGSIIWYSLHEKCFYEVNSKGEIPIVINETTVKSFPVPNDVTRVITEQPFSITETLTKHIVLTCANRIITLNRRFELHNVYQKEGSNFKGISEDPYGRVFVTDYSQNQVCVVTPHGKFQRQISLTDKGILSPTHITRDSCGNIWIYGKTSIIKISYL